MSMLLLLSTLCLFSCEKEEDGDDTSSSTSTSSSSSSSSSSVSSKEEKEDPADVVNPDEPEAKELEIISQQGASEYVIVCDTSNERDHALAKDIKELFSNKYSTSLEIVDKADRYESDKELIIGKIGEEGEGVVKKLYTSNDFAIYEWGDDVVFYATSEYLYDYLLVMTEKIFDGERTTFTSKNNFIYHKSSYKGTLFAQYVKTTRPSGIFDHEGLLQVFEPKSIEATDGTRLNYRIYVPSSYDPENDYPVVLFLHGAGERGSDNARQLLNMLPFLFSLKDNPYHEAIVIAPQCPGGQQWVDTPWGNGNYSTETVKESNELKAVVELINKVGEDFSTDKSRYYAMGISMGGFGTWDIIMRHTEMFAGAMPLCGGADPQMASKLVGFPIWTFHDMGDTTVPAKGTKEMADAIKQACKDAGVSESITYTQLSGYGHIIWNQVGKTSAYSKWLFEQKRVIE